VSAKRRPAVYICGDGPGSYGYGGHECNRKGCSHFRVDHGPEDELGAITGACTKTRCKCDGFEELP
jgi:hypothetical protein